MRAYELERAAAPMDMMSPVYIRLGGKLVEVDRAEKSGDTFGLVLTPAEPLAVLKSPSSIRAEVLEYLRDNCENEIPAEIVALLTT